MIHNPYPTADALDRIAHGLHAVFAHLTGRSDTSFALAIFPEGRTDYVLSGTDPQTANRVFSLLRGWHPRWLSGEKVRIGNDTAEAEVSVALNLQSIADMIVRALELEEMDTRFLLVVFPVEDHGMYAANISRESAQGVVAEMLQILEHELRAN